MLWVGRSVGQLSSGFWRGLWGWDWDCTSGGVVAFSASFILGGPGRSLALVVAYRAFVKFVLQHYSVIS